MVVPTSQQTFLLHIQSKQRRKGKKNIGLPTKELGGFSSRLPSPHKCGNAQAASCKYIPPHRILVLPLLILPLLLLLPPLPRSLPPLLQLIPKLSTFSQLLRTSILAQFTVDCCVYVCVCVNVKRNPVIGSEKAIVARSTLKMDQAVMLSFCSNQLLDSYLPLEAGGCIFG